MSEVNRARAVAAMVMSVDQGTAEISRVLAEAAIPHLLLKGPTFTWFWPHDRVRPYGDSDVLVPAQNFDVACQLLERSGFARRRTVAFSAHATPFERSATSHTIDLHRHIPGVGVDPPRLWSLLTDHLALHAVGGAMVPGLDQVGTTFHAVLHAASHGPTLDKAARDVSFLLANHGTPWRAAAGLAREARAEVPMRLGLALVPDGAALADELGLARAGTMARFFSESAGRGRGLATIRLIPQEGRTRGVIDVVFPSREVLRNNGPAIARRGTIGLMAAYVAGFVVSAGRFVAGVADFVAWATARGWRALARHRQRW